MSRVGLRVDAHQHFWRYDDRDYGWIDDSMEALKRDFLPPELGRLLAESEIDACVAVQARQSKRETDWLIALARQHDFIKGVVGWLDLCSPQLERELEEYTGEAVLKGFRHVLQEDSAAHLMAYAPFKEGVSMIANHGYSYDILVVSKQLPLVLDFVSQLPAMPLVVDHLAKPNVVGEEWEPWASYLKALAAFPHVHCKLSGLLTEARWDKWRTSELERYIDHALNIFTPERLMFGSDWPVCTLAASYQDVVGLVENALRRTDPKGMRNIMGGTAVSFYRL